MRLAFMGTPAFSVPCLAEMIAGGHEIAAVYTKAPQPSGRGQKLKKSDVHVMADSFGLDVFTPKNFKSQESQKQFFTLDLDAVVVVAYGIILPPVILSAPKHGCFNLHASLLPRWRGAAPIHRAIMAGDPQTGVQVMKMEAGLDTGPIVLSETTPIEPHDTTADLHDRLARIGASLMSRALSALERGALEETIQSADGVTYAEKISNQEAKIDWATSAQEVDAKIRGLSPFPGAWFTLEMNGKERRIKALMSSVAEGKGSPGQLLNSTNELVVACAHQAVRITRLQREGRATQSAEEFLRGANLT